MINRLDAISLALRALWDRRKATSEVTVPRADHAAVLSDDHEETPEEVPLALDEDTYVAILECSVRLIHAFAEPIALVIADTEQTAFDIVSRVKQLDQTATQLVGYLMQADLDTLDMQAQIESSSTVIEQIALFMQQLPAKIHAEQQGMQGLLDRLNDLVRLSVMAESIKDVSRLTHMVAINAAIQAAHAGPYGEGFKVVAAEVKRLSTQAGEAADIISDAMLRIHHVVHDYLHNNTQRDFSKDIQEAARMGDSVRQLQQNHEDMRHYYKTLLTVVKEYNRNLSNEIVDTLGSLQFQDVVRQRLERMRDAQSRYCAVLETVVQHDAALSRAPLQADLEQLLTDYMDNEARHSKSSTSDTDEESGPKIELF